MSNWGDDFRKGIGKVKNKQITNRMSFYERSPGKHGYRNEDQDPWIPDFPMPKFKDESHPPNCAPCEFDIEGDPYAHELPTEQGNKNKTTRYYSDFQTERYTSLFDRYNRSIELRMRGVDFVQDLEGNLLYEFCSKRSPNGYWEVRKKAPVKIEAELHCYRAAGLGYEGKTICFLNGFDEEQTINVTNNISPNPTTGLIQVYTWSGEPQEDLSNRVFLRTLPLSGGSFTWSPSQSFKCLSFFAKNPTPKNIYYFDDEQNEQVTTITNYYDGCWFTVEDNSQEIKLIGF